MHPGIYIHLPFCAVHCSYCDFPLTTRLSLSDRYYSALRKEIESNPPAEQADSLYYGGGTPSLTPPEILQTIASQFSLLPDSEITLEANPDDITAEKAKAWRRLGINRLSIGVQSLQDEVLRWMLRRHTSTQVLSAIQIAKDAGIENINFDLMMGCPNQTSGRFLEDLNRLIEFRPQHVSLYMLEVHEGAALSVQLRKEKIQLMPEEDQILCYQRGCALLVEAGFQHYEVSNFALAGFESRHNLKYWNDAPYYAYGAGASSYANSMRSTNLRSVTQYIQAVETGRDSRQLCKEEDHETRMRNALIFGLRKTAGVDIRQFYSAYGTNPFELFGEAGKEYLRDGFLVLDQTHLRLSPKGILVSNEILGSAL